MLTRLCRIWLAKANSGGGKDNAMMPLALADQGKEEIIKKVGGSPAVRQHLEELGFVAGGAVTVVAAMGGNVIVKVKESRIAISEEMARRIMI